MSKSTKIQLSERYDNKKPFLYGQSLFDVGVEVEFFIGPKVGFLNNILNASKTIESLLGFSVDQNLGQLGGKISMPNGFEFGTDGTACEIR